MVPASWKATELGEIAQFSSGGTPSKENSDFWGGIHPWITAKDLKQHYLENSIDTLTDAGVANAKLAPAGASLILVRGMTLLKGFPVGYVTRPMSFNQDIKALIPEKEVDGLFLSFFLASQKEKMRQLVSIAGHGTGRLDTESIKSFPVNLPSLGEQKKIAKILSTWDQAISTTEKLLANSQHQKKALMQKLFSGRVRFPGFSSDWQKNSIGSILKEVKRPVVWDDNNQYKLLSVKRRCEGVILREVLFGHQILTKKMNVVHAGDFLISKMQVVHGAMGLVGLEHHEFYVSDSYISLEAKNKDLIDVDFFWWFCNQKLMAHKAYLCSYGVHIEKMTFNLGLFLKEKIFIPKSIDEQKRIAQVLTTADREIEVLQQKLACLKQEKKALMQQLLTGKRRVKVGES